MKSAAKFDVPISPVPLGTGSLRRVMKEYIYKRKSVRNYKKERVKELDVIESFLSEIVPLDASIQTKIKIVEKDQIHTILPFKTLNCIEITSEKTIQGRMNAGFMGAQLELYLYSLGLGACWMGMASSKEENYCISLCFGYPNTSSYREVLQFKRKEWSDFSDQLDENLKPAYYAPSSMNSQPWYFTHETNKVHLWYIPKSGMFHSLKCTPDKNNQIDLGICLAYLYVSHKNMKISKEKNKKHLNYLYICTIQFKEEEK